MNQDKFDQLFDEVWEEGVKDSYERIDVPSPDASWQLVREKMQRSKRKRERRRRWQLLLTTVASLLIGSFLFGSPVITKAFEPLSQIIQSWKDDILTFRGGNQKVDTSGAKTSPPPPDALLPSQKNKPYVEDKENPQMEGNPGSQKTNAYKSQGIEEYTTPGVRRESLEENDLSDNKEAGGSGRGGTVGIMHLSMEEAKERAQFPMIVPTYVVPGYTQDPVILTVDAEGEGKDAMILYKKPDGVIYSVQQIASGPTFSMSMKVHPEFEAAQDVAVPGFKGSLITDKINGSQMLILVNEQLVVRVSGFLSKEEILKVANSLK